MSFIGVLFLSISGCELFDTREPESPVGLSIPREPLLEPQDALDNIIEAFSDRNASNYMYSFASPSNSDTIFRFVPDITSASYDSVVFEDWGYAKEYNFISNLLSNYSIHADSTASISFEADNILPGESYPIYQEKYAIIIGSSNPELPREYSGIANITFDRNNNFDWVIIKWEDERIPDFPSLTDLKISM